MFIRQRLWPDWLTQLHVELTAADSCCSTSAVQQRTKNLVPQDEPASEELQPPLSDDLLSKVGEREAAEVAPGRVQEVVGRGGGSHKASHHGRRRTCEGEPSQEQKNAHQATRLTAVLSSMQGPCLCSTFNCQVE